MIGSRLAADGLKVDPPDEQGARFGTSEGEIPQKGAGTRRTGQESHFGRVFRPPPDEQGNPYRRSGTLGGGNIGVKIRIAVFAGVA